MKQCSICGYLFEPSDNQSARCPRCGVSLSEDHSQKASVEDPSPRPDGDDPQPAPDVSSQPEEERDSQPPQQEPAPRQDQPEEESPPVPEEQPADPPVPAEVFQPNPEEPSKPSSKYRLLKVIGLLLLLLLVAVCSFFLGVGQSDWLTSQKETSSAGESAASQTTVYNDPQGVSPQEFARLQIGMTYAQISAIIGGDAYQTTIPDVSGSYSASWQGQQDPQATLTVRFVNGQAADLQQNGLTQQEEPSSESSAQE